MARGSSSSPPQVLHRQRPNLRKPGMLRGYLSNPFVCENGNARATPTWQRMQRRLDFAGAARAR
ncbi:hypothetical protein EJ03DRAFT_332370 [Teratosphaeria nubilosa]|uniref:Uncharacterized protein n=1 Tax=Teratosphaeria nubilosa TaxID=161662 RepID=A0A6G1KV02_9PEZI|nr:hypothetical protein EJ03DRAFT_332370 [Teratosphaeria nubilosa]